MVRTKPINPREGNEARARLKFLSALTLRLTDPDPHWVQVPLMLLQYWSGCSAASMSSPDRNGKMKNLLKNPLRPVLSLETAQWVLLKGAAGRNCKASPSNSPGQPSSLRRGEGHCRAAQQICDNDTTALNAEEGVFAFAQQTSENKCK